MKAERFVRSVRNKVLDSFVLFGQKQLEQILSCYIEYFNGQRPHQGIEQQVPGGYEMQTEGKIVSIPTLSGLHHHYERHSAQLNPICLMVEDGYTHEKSTRISTVVQPTSTRQQDAI